MPVYTNSPTLVIHGGTEVPTLTDGGPLLGSGTGAVTAMAVLADSEMIVGDGATDPVAESGATLRTSIGVAIGTDVQAWDAQLDDIAALAVTDGNVIVGDNSNWVAESGAALRTSVGVGTGDAPTFAGLTLTTTTDTLLIPRMTTTQRDALTAADGDLIYNSTLATTQSRTAGAWINVGTLG